MFSVFSDTEKKKQSEQIQMLKNCSGGLFTRGLIEGPEDEPLYMLKPDILPWLKWINSRILFELPNVKNQSDVQWVGVRIRIATNMLNKIEQTGLLDKEICMIYHERLTSRVRKILGNLYTEDLPF